MAAFHHALRVFGGGLFPRPWIPMIILDICIQSILDVNRLGVRHANKQADDLRIVQAEWGPDTASNLQTPGI